MRYSITLASFRQLEPIEQTLAKLARQGYDAVEMYGEPSDIDIKKLKDTLSSYNMPVCGITGMWGSISKDGWKRKLLSADPALVRESEKYVQDCVRMCNVLGGREMNICLFADDKPRFDRTHGTINAREKGLLFAKAIPVINRLCNDAKEHGVELVLEPLNRYSTPYCANTNDAIAMAKKVDLLGILLDTFHMNIEEDSFADAIRNCRDLLRHTHFADNNRKMPGFAHINFYAVMKSLHEINYNNYVSFEPNMADADYEFATKAGLDYVKRIEMRNKAAIA